MKLNTIHSQFCAAVAFLAVAARATPWPRGTATRLSPPNDHVRGLRSKPSTLQKDFMVRGLNDERQVEFPDGVWTSRGYGYVLEANSTTYNIFEETEISCIPTNPTLIQYVLGVELENNNQTAIVDVAGAAAKYVFDETGDFQSGCADGLTPVLGDDNYVHDALRVFDIFAQTFVEHYAFFELRGIDWAALTEDARSKLTGNSTDAELTEALISVLEPLHDYHVSLVTDQVEYHSKPLEIIVQLQQEFVQQDAIDDFENYLNVQLGTWIMTLSSYLDDKILKGTPGEFSWGTATNGTVGYMQLMSMGPEDEVAFADALDQAIVDLQDTHTMIVDVRVNGGGDDLVSLEIASHFTSERFLAFSKRAVNGDDFTQATEVYVEPSDPAYQYDGKVIVIMSGSSGSATEIFCITMAQLPQTTLMGRNTAGGLSDILQRKLPNGWGFGLSNEIYLAPDGALYEMMGVPPEILPDADLLPLAEREAGTDSWLVLALETAKTLEESTPPPTDPSDSSDDSGADGISAFSTKPLLAIGGAVVGMLL